MNIRDVMRMGPVIPVLVIEREQDAVPLARALVAGGIRVLEVTLRTPAALAATALIACQVPQAVVGVGTITCHAELLAARDAGARFGVSPGLTAELIAAIPQVGLPMLPGVMTPSEVMTARAAGFDALKLFPAAQAGGVTCCRRWPAPFPSCCFAPPAACAPTAWAIPGAAQRGLRGRLLADAARRGGRRRLGAHHRAGTTGLRSGARHAFDPH
jgi:2-dehydro-3-deoxyphosphogluconate aldolase/(4S)-4-hydroxy-2-oxoglutarate aldolase